MIMTNSKPSVSVIVPVHRAGKFLEDLIQSLQHQTARHFEVILVGFHHTELQKRALPPGFFYVRAKSRWPDVKRNLGAQKAKGDILAYTDEDCIPDPHWVRAIEHVFSMHSKAAAIEGATRGEQKKLFSHSIQNEKGGWYPTCNMAFRKKDFVEIGGFDESYHFFREDLDIVFKLKHQNKTVLFSPLLHVFHPERKTDWRSILDELFMVKGDVRLYKKFPALYTKRFGFLCRGSFKQSLVVWFLLALVFVGIQYHPVLVLFGILGLVLFRYLVSMKKFQFSFSEGIQFFLAATARDLLFPFFVTYYWLTIHPK